MKKKNKIRMAPPPLQLVPSDLHASGIEYPVHKGGRKAPKLARIKYYGGPAPVELDTRLLETSTNGDEVPATNDVTGTRVDIPFVSRTTVQPTASMQQIIPR